MPKTFEEKVKSGELITTTTAAELTGYTAHHIRRLCHSGVLPYVLRNGWQIFFSPSDVKALVAHHAKGGAHVCTVAGARPGSGAHVCAVAGNGSRA